MVHRTTALGLALWLLTALHGVDGGCPASGNRVLVDPQTPVVVRNATGVCTDCTNATVFYVGATDAASAVQATQLGQEGLELGCADYSQLCVCKQGACCQATNSSTRVDSVHVYYHTVNGTARPFMYYTGLGEFSCADGSTFLATDGLTYDSWGYDYFMFSCGGCGAISEQAKCAVTTLPALPGTPTGCSTSGNRIVLGPGTPANLTNIQSNCSSCSGNTILYAGSDTSGSAVNATAEGKEALSLTCPDYSNLCVCSPTACCLPNPGSTVTSLHAYYHDDGSNGVRPFMYYSGLGRFNCTDGSSFLATDGLTYDSWGYGFNFFSCSGCGSLIQAQGSCLKGTFS